MARRDFASIIGTIAEEASQRTAARWSRRILKQVGALTDRPFLGAVDEHLGSGRRRLVLAPYLIVYELASPTEITVLRILHGARDLPTLFRQSSSE
jgi:plasmid stabilization system protein ParE